MGAAAVGAAAAGAYRGSCYDAYGNYVAPAGTVRTERRDLIDLTEVHLMCVGAGPTLD